MVSGWRVDTEGEPGTISAGMLVIQAEGFFVKDLDGPLKDGELERAAAQAQQIMAKA
jgi:hypothetical protein